MVAAVNVTVSAFADIGAGDLQGVLQQMQGKAQYAAEAAGAATYKAEQAQAKADTLEGSVAYAADKAGFLDYHVRQIAAMVGHSMPA